MTDKLNDSDRQRIEQEALESLWEKMSREDWLAGEGFSGKVGGLTKIPYVCKDRIFEFAKEYATLFERQQQAKEQIESEANALLLVKLLDLCDRCYHYMRANPPDKTKMIYNEWEEISSHLTYYKSENSLKTK